MRTTQLILIVSGIGLLAGCARWLFECMFVVPLAPDPQDAIWVLNSTVASSFIALTVAASSFIAIRAFALHSFATRILASIPFFLLIAWYSTGFIDLAYTRAALIDSADQSTSPDRLRELANYKGGPGYEIDNRIARHPNTPDDVLQDLADRDDKWSEPIKDSLRRNPRYADLLSPSE